MNYKLELMKLFRKSYSGHAELVEASLPLRYELFNEAGEMLRQAQHDVLIDFSDFLNSFNNYAAGQKMAGIKNIIL